MPTFSETLGFLVYLTVMYSGMPDRELLATAYAGGAERSVPEYRGIRDFSSVGGRDDSDDSSGIDKAAA